MTVLISSSPDHIKMLNGGLTEPSGKCLPADNMAAMLIANCVLPVPACPANRVNLPNGSQFCISQLIGSILT